MAGLIVSDLAGMRTKVKDWADREDLGDSVVDDFINIAIEKLNKAIRIPFTEVTATISFVGDVMPLPADYLNTKQLTVSSGGNTVKVEIKDLGYVEEQASVSLGGVPLYFARKGTDMTFAPSPSGVTEAEFTYYVEVDSLVDDTDTNWFITDGTTATLYGAMKELFGYVSDEDEEARWEQRFIGAAQDIQDTYDKAEWSGDTLSVTLGG